MISLAKKSMVDPPLAVLINTIEKTVIELKDDTISIGRDPTCTISIMDPLLSRFHAELTKLPDGKYKIKDCSSSYGTFVRGEKVNEHILGDGDEITVGTTCFRLQMNYDRASDEKAPIDSNADAVESYPTMDSVWENGSQFLDNFEIDNGVGRFFHPVPKESEILAEAKPGALLSVRIRFLDKDVSFHVHTIVREQRTEEKKGILLEFLKEEKERQELVLVYTQGESIPYFRRRDERISCRLKVQVDIDQSKQLTTIATNISNSGIYLVPEHSIKLKMVIRLLIYFPNQTKIGVTGRVVSNIPDGPQKGMGIEFLFSSSGERKKMIKQVGLLRTS